MCFNITFSKSNINLLQFNINLKRITIHPVRFNIHPVQRIDNFNDICDPLKTVGSGSKQ